MVVPRCVECELVSWERASALAGMLANRVLDSGYAPDLVIAVARGGYVPARIVCDCMLLGELASIKVEHWGIAARRSGGARIAHPLPIGIGGRKVLVVDDVTDTGDTMAVILEYLHSLSPSEVKVGVLHHKTSSRFVPDYMAEVQTEWRWIVYPWAVYEDLGGFISKILEEGAFSREQLEDALVERYRIRVEAELLVDVLSRLQKLGRIVAQGGTYRRLT